MPKVGRMSKEGMTPKPVLAMLTRLRIFRDLGDPLIRNFVLVL